MRFSLKLFFFFPLPSQIFLDLSPLPETEQHLRPLPVRVTTHPLASDEVRITGSALDSRPSAFLGAFWPRTCSVSCKPQPACLQKPALESWRRLATQCDKVNGYRVPSSADEGMNYPQRSVCHAVAGLRLWPPQKRARAGRYPSAEPGADLKNSLSPPAFLCFVSKSFLLFVKVQRRGFFKEQRNKGRGCRRRGARNRKEEGSRVR